MDIWEYSDGIKEKEGLFLENARKHLKETNLHLKKSIYKACTVQDLQKIKVECIQKKNDLKLLIQLKGNHLGLKYKNHIKSIEYTNRRFFEMLEEILEEVEARIKVNSTNSPWPSNKHADIKTFADLFPQDKADKYIAILKNELPPDGLEIIVDENNKWNVIKEVGSVFLDELKNLEVIRSKSLAGKLMQEQFKCFKYSKTTIDPRDDYRQSNDYRQYFRDEINRIKNS